MLSEYFFLFAFLVLDFVYWHESLLMQNCCPFYIILYVFLCLFVDVGFTFFSLHFRQLGR